MTNHVRVVSANVGALLQLLLGLVRRQLRLLTRVRPIPFGLRRVRLYTCRGGRLRMDERACLRRCSWGLRLYRSGTGQNGLRQLPRPECGRIQPELLAETCRGVHTQTGSRWARSARAAWLEQELTVRPSRII